MDKLVRRVTVVHGSGEHRDTKVVYESDEDEDFDDSLDILPDILRFFRPERTVRNLLKAHVITAQDAYQRHLDSAARGGSSWMIDDPGNLLRAHVKGLRALRQAAPFGWPRVRIEEDEYEGD